MTAEEYTEQVERLARALERERQARREVTGEMRAAYLEATVATQLVGRWLEMLRRATEEA